MTDTLFVCPVLSQISLVTFLIKNSTELFGQDIVALWYETSFYHSVRENTSCVEITPSNISKLNQTNHGDSICPKGSTYTAAKDEPTINLVAPPQSEGIIGVYMFYYHKLKVRII